MTGGKSDKAAINVLELNGARITNSKKLAKGFNKFFAEEKWAPPSMNLLTKPAIVLVCSV